MDGWRYDGPKSCNQLTICIRCGHKRTRHATNDEDHERWTEWDYAAPLNCAVFSRHCLRCGKENTKMGREVHQYSEWVQTSRTQLERRCVRCRHRDWKSLN
jgi:DNA-directed RNA polymerase subunit RPC12/RpoP